MAKGSQPYPADPGVVGHRGAVYRITEGGETRDVDRVVVEQPRILTFRGTGSTFRTAGNAAATQNLWSIENAAGSTVLIALRKLNVFTGTTSTGVSTALPPWLNLYRITALPTGGSAFTKTSVDSTDGTSNASVVVRGAASADGTASAITATAAGQRLASVFTGQVITASGANHPQRIEVIDPELAADQPFILNAGQAYLLQLSVAAAADNIATRSFIVNARWEEFTAY